MTTVTAVNTELVESRGALTRYFSEASSLQLDGWPTKLDTTLGNGQPLIRHHIERDDEGQPEAVKYVQNFGCIELTIFND